MSASGAERRKRKLAKVEAGLIPARRRSHYTKPQIIEVVRQQLTDMRTQIEEHRSHTRDPNWAFRAAAVQSRSRKRGFTASGSVTDKAPSCAQQVAQLVGIIGP